LKTSCRPAPAIGAGGRSTSRPFRTTLASVVLEIPSGEGWDQARASEMARSTFYVTTAIDYANDLPHLGNVLEKVQADCIARYRRLSGDRVHFVTGMDEHGQTVAWKAASRAAAPHVWVDAIAAAYQEVLRTLAISCDDFIRTTEPRHARAVRDVLRRILQLHPADVYEAACTGFYCAGCEAFKADDDLVEGRCEAHPTIALEWVEERNHFFRLSAYAPRLRAYFEAHPEFVVPAVRFEEARRLVASGLRDVAISRRGVRWGMTFPDAPEHTVYVWFDALVNYLSATGFPDDRYDQLWPADLHIVGPDIMRFHAVLWPAMLMAAELELPRQIWAHGWLKTNGARFSKTAGVGISLQEAIERHGPDALRYFLLLAMPWDGDGEFSWERFESVYTAELATNLGSLASRTLALISGQREGRVPPAAADGELDRSHRSVLERYREVMDALRLSEGALELGRLGRLANRHLDERGIAEASRAAGQDQALAELHRALVRVAALAYPFMPAKAEELYRALGGHGSIAMLRWEQVAQPDTAGWQVVSGDPLFPTDAAR
jgi:methionyl-tRNA synthetase